MRPFLPHQPRQPEHLTHTLGEGAVRVFELTVRTEAHALLCEQDDTPVAFIAKHVERIPEAVRFKLQSAEFENTAREMPGKPAMITKSPAAGLGVVFV